MVCIRWLRSWRLHAFLNTRTALQVVPDLSCLHMPWVPVDGLALWAYMPEHMTEEVYSDWCARSNRIVLAEDQRRHRG